MSEHTKAEREALSYLDELEAGARKATPGPWRNDNGYRVYAPNDRDSLGESVLVDTKYNCFDGLDAEYISACSPERMLAFIQCLRQSLLRPGAR
jgi:hypothetical protein